MTAFLGLGLLAAFFAAWLAHLMWLERDRPLRSRLEPSLAIVISLLVLWGLGRYGDALVRWIWR